MVLTRTLMAVVMTKVILPHPRSVVAEECEVEAVERRRLFAVAVEALREEEAVSEADTKITAPTDTEWKKWMPVSERATSKHLHLARVAQPEEAVREGAACPADAAIRGDEADRVVVDLISISRSSVCSFSHIKYVNHKRFSRGTIFVVNPFCVVQERYIVFTRFMMIIILGPGGKEVSVKLPRP